LEESLYLPLLLFKLERLLSLVVPQLTPSGAKEQSTWTLNQASLNRAFTLIFGFGVDSGLCSSFASFSTGGSQVGLTDKSLLRPLNYTGLATAKVDIRTFTSKTIRSLFCLSMD